MPASLVPSPVDLARPLRVMVVDDMLVVRGLFARWIDAEPDLSVVACLRNGREAVDQIEHIAPDVVVLDIDMPDMDGITALPILLKKKPGLTVIMASTLTHRNAELGLRAIALGAAECIAKPETNKEVTTSLAFQRELIETVRVLGRRSRDRTLARYKGAVASVRREDAPSIVPDQQDALRRITLRAFSAEPPRALMIGCSTGGPQALAHILPRLITVIDSSPLLITQHMPAAFTTILAEHLQRAVKRPVHEAIDGEEIKAGTVYVAPGGRHLRVAQFDGVVRAVLDDSPPVNFCKPAVDPMFASGAVVWGSSLLALVLTGMGSDGRRGTEAVAAAGGSVIAQDEASSVVWGMPGQAAATGLCSAVLSVEEIPGKITRLFAGAKV
jgi:two-component system chemotaxis response regulator CheB